jgi:hypothetical protein
MNNIDRHPPNPLTLLVVAVGDWLMVLPAAMLLAGAAVRLLQPSQHEPARTVGIINQWVQMHITGFTAGVFFLGLPGIAAALGCVTLLRLWRNDATLRQDAVTALAIVRRHFVAGLLTGATLLAAAIFFAVVAHIITD